MARGLFFLAALAALVVLVGGVQSAAAGTTYVVTKTADTNDGACDSDCSLREATIAANANPGTDTIIVPAGTYTLTIPGMDEDAAATGDLDVTDDLTISGAGAATTVIDGGGLDRVLHVVYKVPAVNVVVEDLTIRNGSVAEVGGGVSNAGHLDLVNVVVRDNTASSGGALGNGGTVQISDSKLTNNKVADSGGAISNGPSGIITLLDSTIGGNDSGFGGGGIENMGIVDATNLTVTGNTTSTQFGGGAGIVNANDQGSGVEATVTIRGGLITGNSTKASAGGVSNGGSIDLSDVTVANNTAVYSSGGIGNSAGSLRLLRVTVSGNSSGTGTGGITNAGGTATITESAITGNSTSSGSGGGITNGGYYPDPALAGQTTVADSTISGNSTPGSGGGVYNSKGTVSLTNSTLADNTASSGANVYGSTGTSTTFTNSILTGAGSCAGASAALTSAGHNIASDATCSLSGPGDMNNTDPKLAALADNGGRTPTMALLAGSPAIDAANPVSCPPIDQRGVIRPIDGNGDGAAVCDIGAYEFGDADADGILDGSDNCPNWYNPAQILPPWTVPAGDPDCDGFTSAVESFVGTDPLLHCGANAWPPDFNSSGKVDIVDIVLLKPHFNSTAASPAYSARFDLNADYSVKINDVVIMKNFFNNTCS